MHLRVGVKSALDCVFYTSIQRGILVYSNSQFSVVVNTCAKHTKAQHWEETNLWEGCMRKAVGCKSLC